MRLMQRWSRHDAGSRRPFPRAARAHGPGHVRSPASDGRPYARTYPSGPFTVVEVTGEIDLATSGFLAEHLDAATSRPGPDVLVDLRRVDFFDCSGLRELCRADTRARERGGRLRLVSDTPASTVCCAHRACCTASRPSPGSPSRGPHRYVKGRSAAPHHRPAPLRDRAAPRDTGIALPIRERPARLTGARDPGP